MTRKVRVFARTDLGTECEVCGMRFDLLGGGACVKCRRVLCGRHLYGSWLRRLMVDLGAAPVCCMCRQAS